MAFPTGWGRKQKLLIQSSKVSGNLTDFPVLVTKASLPTEMFDADGSFPALNGGGDIRFSSNADGSTQLALEVVSFVTDNDPANGSAELWVKVPAVDSSVDTAIWVWYNKAGESQPAADSTYGSENVWDSNFKMVWHGTGLDGSTDSDITGTAVGAVPGTGKIGGGYSFNGNQDVVDLADPNNALEDTSIVYVEVWAQTDDYTAADQAILADIKSTNTFNGVSAEFNRTAYGVVGTFSTFISDGSFGWASTAHNVADANFHHLIYSIWDDGATVKTDYYVDAVSKGQTSIGSPSGWNFTGKTDCGLGNLANNPVAGLSYDGVLCEVRVSDIRRDQVAGYVATNYNSQNSPGTFIVVDQEAPTGVEITSPTALASDVAINPTITCSVGSDDQPPISYYFELADDSGFSVSVQNSGWILGTSWVPSTLSTSMTYYVHVKARDSATTPNVSAYSVTIMFTTTSGSFDLSKILLALDADGLVNGDFETGATEPWSLYLNTSDLSSMTNATFDVSTTAPSGGLYNGLVVINSQGPNIADIQLMSGVTNFELFEDQIYIVSFDGKASAGKGVQIRVTDISCSEINYGLLSTNSFATSWGSHAFVFQSTIDTTSKARVRFLMGNSGTNVEVDNLYFQEIIEVKPTYNYQAKTILNRYDYRTVGGQLYTYNFEKWKRWELPETFVSSKNRVYVNSWWTGNNQVRLIEDSSAPANFILTKIVNNEEPYQNYAAPFFEQYFTGELLLETVTKV